MQPTARIAGFVFKGEAEPERLPYIGAYDLDGLVDIEVSGLPCHLETDCAWPNGDDGPCVEAPHVHNPTCGKTRIAIPFQHFERHTPKPPAKINVWRWDGDRSAPTLQPSFLTWWGPDDKPDFRFHCFIRRGELDLLSDSIVEGVPMAKA